MVLDRDEWERRAPGDASRVLLLGIAAGVATAGILELVVWATSPAGAQTRSFLLPPSGPATRRGGSVDPARPDRV